MFSQSNTTLQNSLDKIYNWLKEINLNLSPCKRQVVNIQKSITISTFDFRINSINLSSTKLFKDLGIFIAENLKWNHHFNYLYRFVSTTSFQVFKSFKSTDTNILKKLFVIYIRPKLEYYTQIWFPYLKKYINHIESIQRKYTRLIFNCCNISYTSYLGRLTKLIKSLEYRTIVFDFITFFKLITVKLKLIYNKFSNFIELITH